MMASVARDVIFDLFTSITSLHCWNHEIKRRCNLSILLLVSTRLHHYDGYRQRIQRTKAWTLHCFGDHFDHYWMDSCRNSSLAHVL